MTEDAKANSQEAIGIFSDTRVTRGDCCEEEHSGNEDEDASMDAVAAKREVRPYFEDFS